MGLERVQDGGVAVAVCGDGGVQGVEARGGGVPVCACEGAGEAAVEVACGC